MRAHTDARGFLLEVWNDGVPIPAGSVTKICDPFCRHSTASSRLGLGLGLHISLQIESVAPQTAAVPRSTPATFFYELSKGKSHIC